jgi:hypothetical protein
MPDGLLVRRVGFQQQRAQQYLRLSRMRHRRAAALARRALMAQKAGRPVQARNLMRRALEIKAGAGRAAVRSRLHRARAAELRRAQGPAVGRGRPGAGRGGRPQARRRAPMR